MEIKIKIEAHSENLDKVSEYLKELLTEGWRILKMDTDTEKSMYVTHYCITLIRKWE